MKMTKTLALMALVAGGLLAGTNLQAQDNPGGQSAAPHGSPGMRGRPNLDRLAKELSLTDDQKTKLQAALDDEMTKMRELHKDTSLSKEDKRAKAKELREATQTQIKGILTPDQLEKWHKLMKQHGPHGKKKPAAGGNN
jgi:Spy/CpxP family protein refolding chaperone